MSRQVARHAPADGGGVARTDKRNGRAVKQLPVAAHGQHGRRRVDGGKAGGVFWLTGGQMLGADLDRCVHFTSDLRLRGAP